MSETNSASPPPLANLLAALAKAQAEFPDIPKDKIAEYPTKTGGRVEFAYSDLATILRCTRQALTKHGLSVLQPVRYCDGKATIRTMLAHESGEYLDEIFELLAGGGRMQEIGSAITYARRYSLAGMLGISSEEDDDNSRNPHRDERPKDPVKPKPAVSDSVGAQPPFSQRAPTESNKTAPRKELGPMPPKPQDGKLTQAHAAYVNELRRSKEWPAETLTQILKVQHHTDKLGSLSYEDFSQLCEFMKTSSLEEANRLLAAVAAKPQEKQDWEKELDQHGGPLK